MNKKISNKIKIIKMNKVYCNFKNYFYYNKNKYDTIN